MPRTRLTEREKYEFRFSLQVRPQDVNYGGHLGNDSLISLIGTARAYLFRNLGFSELDLGDGSTGIIISDLTVNYRAEAFLFDELVIETHVAEIESTRFRMHHRVTKQSKLVALVEVGFVAYSYEQKKPIPIPAPFLKALSTRQGSL